MDSCLFYCTVILFYCTCAAGFTVLVCVFGVTRTNCWVDWIQKPRYLCQQLITTPTLRTSDDISLKAVWRAHTLNECTDWVYSWKNNAESFIAHSCCADDSTDNCRLFIISDISYMWVTQLETFIYLFSYCVCWQIWVFQFLVPIDCHYSTNCFKVWFSLPLWSIKSGTSHTNWLESIVRCVKTCK